MRTRFIRRLLLCSALIVCAAGVWLWTPPPVARAAEPPYFAIRDVRIVPVTGPVIEHGTVVIAKGLIQAVGADVAVPPEAWVVDGKGLTVYPGLIDAGTGVGLAAPEPPSGGGRPGGGGPPQQQKISQGPEDRPATSPWVSAADELKPDDKRIENWREAGFTSALVLPQGGIFPGQGALINLAGDEPGEMVVQSPAALPIELRPLRGFRSFPDSLMGVLAYVHQVFMDAAWYRDAESVYSAHPRGLQRPEYDRTERVLAHVLRSRELVLVPAETDTQISRALRLAPQWGARFALFNGQEAYTTANAIAAAKVPVIVSIKWPESPKNADPEAEEPLRVLRFRHRAPSTPAVLHKAGVKFAFASDGIAAPKDILKNARKAIEAGLSSDAALRAFTLDAAEILGVADRLGSIEPGKIANLVVTDGDLFAEKTKVKMVFVDGRKFEIREPERPKEPPKGNLTGKWKLTFTTPQGAQEATADLTMAPDGTVSGTVTGRMGTSTISSGWLSDTHFSFTVTVTRGARSQEVSYSGTLEGNSLHGTISLGGFAVDFTGTRPDSRQAEVAR